MRHVFIITFAPQRWDEEKDGDEETYMKSVIPAAIFKAVRGSMPEHLDVGVTVEIRPATLA